MQKKTRSRLSEVFFIFICVCCSMFSVYQFYQSLNRTLVKDEEPIATISFKYKTAQRKFIDDLLWDRLQQDSPVYEGDTIRTAEQSEATISFIDGNIMELQSNTMIRVNLSEDGAAEVDFTSGAINVRTGESASMKIRSGSSVVEVAANASVAAAGGSEESGPLKVAVKDGAASFTGDNGTIDLEAGKVTEISAEGTIEEHFLSVNYPEDNYRTMTFNSPESVVAFSWESAGRTVILETSDSKNFDTITSTNTYEDSRSARLTLSEGAHWWRLTTIPASADEQPERITGKLTVIYSPAPTLIAPRAGNETYYRTKLPQVRLSWSEAERATAYRVDIADNPNMRNPVISQKCTTTSTVISSLSEGMWYWTVTPYYTFNNIGYADASQSSYFRITQSAELNTPVLQSPESGGIVCTQVPLTNGQVSYKTVLFSWKNDPEAASYDLTLWKEGSSTPLMTKTVSANYCSVDTAKDAIPKGNITWQVVIRDTEGNTKASAKRTFYSIDAEIEQKTLFPPDTYHVVASRTTDFDYTWKTNVPFATKLEVAKDRNFNNIVLSTETTETSVPGKLLEEGTYYWKISSQAGSALITTPVKTLFVEPLMPQPEIISPANGGGFVIKPELNDVTEETEETTTEAEEEEPPALKWKTVEGADYYQVRVYNKDNPDVYVIDQNFITSKDGETVNLPIIIEEIGGGSYGWTVQAFRNETALASRSSSTVTTNSFIIREVHPITLSAPQDKTAYDGILAWTSPKTFTWKTGDVPVSSTLILYRGSVSEKNIVRTWKNPRSGMQMPSLSEGTYWWTVKAETVEGFNISAAEARSFTVSRVPPLVNPELIIPDNGTVFGVDYLKNNRSITFEWTPVPDATQYVFTLSNEEGTLESLTLPANSASYVLEDLSVLKNGTITWTVRAERYFGTKLLQSSDTVSAEFVIDLPTLSIPQIKDFGKRYGL